MLQKNFADFMKDLEANEARVAGLSKLAKKLLMEGHPESELIESRQEAVEQNWEDLTTLANEREEKLAGAHEIQKFNRSDKELRSRDKFMLVAPITVSHKCIILLVECCCP